MDERFKQRAVGLVVLVALAIIVVPLVFDFGGPSDDAKQTAEIGIPRPPTEMTTVTIPLSDPNSSTPESIVSSPRMPIVDDMTAEVNPDNGSGSPAASSPSPDQAASGEPESDFGPTVSTNAATSALPASGPPIAAVSPPVDATAPKPAVSSPPPVAQAKPAPAPKVPVKPTPTTSASSGSNAWAVQVGSFSQNKNAELLRKRLQSKGYRAFLVTNKANGQTIVRVRVGPELLRANAEKIKLEIERDLKLQAMVVAHR